MKMDDMVTWLERRGFTAKKEYDPILKGYHFYVLRDGDRIKDFFRYPHQHRAEVDAIQRRFLNGIVEKFNILYPKKPESTGLSVTGSKREWTDPASGKTFSYDWGVDTSKAKEYNAIYITTGRSAGKIAFMNYVKENNMCTYPTIREVYETLTGIQKAAVEKMISEAMNDYDAPQIKDVKFSPPATIVFWTDNTKTVVKCQENDIFDPEKGLAMAYMKKSMGNKGNYFNEVKKWTEKYEEPKSVCVAINDSGFNIASMFKKAVKEFDEYMKNSVDQTGGSDENAE